MPTYEFICISCGNRFEHFQAMSAPDPNCPACGAALRRAVTAASGIIMRASSGYTAHGCQTGGCSYETTGKTCCGSGQRCASGGCGES